MTSSFPALLAQVAGAQPATGPSGTVFFAEMAVIIAIFYFLLIRPQRKQQRELENSLMRIVKGDEVVTAGGVIGEVVYIKETLKDGKPVGTLTDRVTIRSGESKLVVERGKITRVTSATLDAKARAPKAEG